MKGFVENIEKLSIENENFRKVLYTAKNSQLVLMSLKPGEDIGEEVHTLDQFFRVEKGMGKAVLDGVEHEISDGAAIIVPRHKIKAVRVVCTTDSNGDAFVQVQYPVIFE